MKVPIIVFKTVNGFSASIVGLKYLYLCHETYEELKEVGEPIPTAENPLFLAKDVAELIGNKNVTEMVAKIDTDEVTRLNLGGQKGVCNFLTEDGLYEVLMQSRKPIAKDIAEWIENKNVSQMLNIVDEEEKGIYNTYTLGGTQKAWFLTEDGLYEVLI